MAIVTLPKPLSAFEGQRRWNGYIRLSAAVPGFRHATLFDRCNWLACSTSFHQMQSPIRGGINCLNIPTHIHTHTHSNTRAEKRRERNLQRMRHATEMVEESFGFWFWLNVFGLLEDILELLNCIRIIFESEQHLVNIGRWQTAWQFTNASSQTTKSNAIG